MSDRTGPTIREILSAATGHTPDEIKAARDSGAFARWEATDNVLTDIERERIAQYRKWGQQDHPDSFTTYPLIPFLRSFTDSASELAYRAKVVCEDDVVEQAVCWQHILLKEVFEVLKDAQRARHPEDLRAELIQVAAVAVAWVEAIDRREAE